MLTVNSNGTVQLTRGDTAEFVISIANRTDGSEYYVQEGDTLTLSLKKTVKDNSYVLQKTAVGTNVIRIEPADTAELAFTKYVYDVQLTTAGGDVYTVISPTTFEITTEVTC